MGGFKLTKEDFAKPKGELFWDAGKSVDETEAQLTQQHLDHQHIMSVDESIAVENNIREWKNKPELQKNVLAIVPKRSVFLTDELDLQEDKKLEELKRKYTGAKLDRKTRDLKASIKNQKRERKRRKA